LRRRGLLLLGVAATATAAALATVAVATTLARGGGGLLLGVLTLGEVALVDPDLDADAAERGAGLEEAEVDVRAQRVQRHTALAVELRPAHLRAAEAAGDLHLDALGAGALRGLDALAHGATERHAGGELLGDALRDQLGVGLGVLDLEDVQLDLLAGELLELAAQAVRLGATATDDDAGTRGVQVDADPVTGALDLDLRDAGALDARGHELADRDVFLHVVAVALPDLGAVREPPGAVVRRDAQAVAVGIDLLAHGSATSCVLVGHDHGDVAGALEHAAGAPLRTGAEPLERRPLVDERLGDDEVGLVEALRGQIRLHASVGDRALDELAHRLGSRLRGELELRQHVGRALPADRVDDAASLLG